MVGDTRPEREQFALGEYEDGETPDEVTEVVNVNDTDRDVDQYIGRYRTEDDDLRIHHMNNTDVGEPGWLGNPYKVDVDGGRAEVIAKFRMEFAHRIAEDEEFRQAVLELQGDVLGCWCKPEACHGDVIKSYLDNHRGKESYLREVKEGGY